MKNRVQNALVALTVALFLLCAATGMLFASASAQGENFSNSTVSLDDGAVSAWYGNYSGSNVAWFDSIQYIKTGSVGTYSGIRLKGMSHAFSAEDLADQCLVIQMSVISHQPIIYIRLQNAEGGLIYPIGTLDDVRLVQSGANIQGKEGTVAQAETNGVNAIKLTQATLSNTQAGQYAYYSFCGYIVMPLSQFNASDAFTLESIMVYAMDNGNLIRLNLGNVYVENISSVIVGGTYSPTSEPIYTPTTENFAEYNSANNVSLSFVEKGTVTLSQYYSGTAWADSTLYITAPQSLRKTGENGDYIDLNEVKGLVVTVDNTDGEAVTGLQLRAFDPATAPSSGANFRYTFNNSKAYLLREGSQIWESIAANSVPAGVKGKIYIPFDAESTFSYVNGTIAAMSESDRLNPVLRLYVNARNGNFKVEDFSWLTGTVGEIGMQTDEHLRADLSSPYLIDANQVNLKVTADEHYTLSSAMLNGADLTQEQIAALLSGSGYSFGVTSQSNQVLLTAAPVMYPVSYDTDGGTLTGTGEDSFGIESDVAIGYTAEKRGYTFVGWYVVSEGALTQIKLTDLNADALAHLESGTLSLRAVYTQKTVYSINISSSEGGRIRTEPNGTELIEGDKLTIFFEPDALYALTGATVNGADVTALVRSGKYEIASVTEDVSVSAVFTRQEQILISPDRINIWNYAYGGSWYAALDGVNYRKNYVADGVTGVTLQTAAELSENAEIEIALHIATGSPKLSFSFGIGGQQYDFKNNAEVVFVTESGQENILTAENGKLTLAAPTVRESDNWVYLSLLGKLRVPLSALDGAPAGSLESVTVYSTGTADNALRYTVGEISVNGVKVWDPAAGGFSMYDPNGVAAGGEVTVERVSAGTMSISQQMNYDAETEKYSYANGHVYLSFPEQTYEYEQVSDTRYVYTDLAKIKGISLRIENQSQITVSGLYFYIYDYVTGSPGTYATGRSTLSTSPCIRVSDDGVVDNNADPSQIPAGFTGTLFIPFTEQVFKNQPTVFPEKIKPILHITVNAVNETAFQIGDVQLYTSDESWQTYDVTAGVASGGNVTMSSPAVFSGGSVTVSVTADAGYEIGSCAYYVDNTEKHEFTLDENGQFVLENIGGDVLVQVEFVAIRYTIDYVLNGGENAAENPSEYYVYGTNIILQDASRDGYEFGGWYMDEACTQAVSVIPRGSTGNITLYAKWNETGGCSGRVYGISALAGTAAIVAAGFAVISLRKGKKDD